MSKRFMTSGCDLILNNRVATFQTPEFAQMVGDLLNAVDATARSLKPTPTASEFARWLCEHVDGKPRLAAMVGLIEEASRSERDPGVEESDRNICKEHIALAQQLFGGLPKQVG